MVGQFSSAQKVKAWSDAQKNAILKQCWNGQWLKRAWVPKDIGWIGDMNGIFLSPQTWSILRDLPKEMTEPIVKEIDSKLRKPSPIGAAQASAPYPHTPPGTGENGAVWASQSYPLVWALTKVNKSMAYDEWLKNTLAYEAEAYPNYWAGIWSSSDSVDSFLSSTPGLASWPEMPILCTHRHAWPLFTAAKIAGIEFTSRGIHIEPSIPLSAGNFSFESDLASVFRTVSSGRIQSYYGHYSPAQYGNWHVSLALEEVVSFEGVLWVNGEKQTPKQTPLKRSTYLLEFQGEGGKSFPLSWELVF